MIEIRRESERDVDQVFNVNASAFEGEAEARLVEALRHVDGYIGLVAERDGQVVGHISFSPVTLGDQTTLYAGLAPMSVMPERQRQGIGSRLIADGLAACREAGFTAVFVLGHSDYYPKFGFTTASLKGFSCEYPAPDEFFMLLELQPGSLAASGGLIKYDPVFAGF